MNQLLGYGKTEITYPMSDFRKWQNLFDTESGFYKEITPGLICANIEVLKWTYI